MAERLLFGPPGLSERLRLPDGRELAFEVHPRAFFQPNTRQAERLYGEVMAALSAAGGPPTGRVLDLYCGTGTIGLCVAPLAQEVVGIELQPNAVADATRNAERNHVDNARFICGDVGAVLARDGLATPGSAAVAVVDPPRSGLAPAAARLVADLAVPRLIYVSCNPAALANDALIMRRAGYRLSRAQPVDMFPHAWHVETVARFDR
jgi:23S rRNA (uracil1939-C5)-methyltransferase